MVAAMLRDRTVRITLAGMAGIVIAYALLAWQRRWICDDGLIAVRTARELLAGHGPVFNAFERAESNTSTLWTYVLAFGSFITRANVTRFAVFGGIALAVAAVGFAADAVRRWHAGRGILVPCGAFLMIGVSAYWDFASSGLETGLTFFWLAVAWWLLVGLRPESSWLPGIALVLGLGPLVRPDLGLASAVFLVAAWLIIRPPLRRTLVLGACAIALPLAYEIFRAGYYGLLVPLPALAKSASASEWGRGLRYAADLQRVYDLWIPLVVLQVLLVIARPRGRDRIIFATPIVAGLLLALYVVRVGGDFMHARMLLPALFILIQPVFFVPATRRTLPLVAIIAVWAFVLWFQADPHHSRATRHVVEDERNGYMRWTGREHPDDDDAYRHRAEPITGTVEAALREGRRLLLTEGGVAYPFDPKVPARVALVMGRLGTGGAIAPLDDIAYDTLGLANPIGARITITHPEEGPGHQKVLPTPWILADLGDPQRIADTDVSPIQVRAARHALRCGELAELVASVREPMSPHRFWENLVGSVRRTRLVVPADPRDAEVRFCGSNSFHGDDVELE